MSALSCSSSPLQVSTATPQRPVRPHSNSPLSHHILTFSVPNSGACPEVQNRRDACLRRARPMQREGNRVRRAHAPAMVRPHPLQTSTFADVESARAVQERRKLRRPHTVQRVIRLCKHEFNGERLDRAFVLRVVFKIFQSASPTRVCAITQ